MLREGLASFLRAFHDFQLVGEASNGIEFLELLKHMKPDLVLMDIDMPHMNGLEATQKAMELIPDLNVVAFTMFADEDYYYKMIDLGVKGFLLKSSGIQELEKAIQEIMMGESYFSNELLRKIISNIGRNAAKKPVESHRLTSRELEVLQHICMGMNNDEVAEKLFISTKTVKSHRSNLLEKTNCKNTPALILFAVRNKLIEI